MKIKTLFLDFDGVLTDNCAYVNEHGEEFVKVNRSDGMYVQLIKSMGVEVIIISSEVNKAVITRANKLGIECYNGVKDKSQVLNRLSMTRGIDLSESMFIGNDLNDLIALMSVGYPACPKDAVEEVKDIAKYVFDVNGGAGIVRQVYKLLN